MANKGVLNDYIKDTHSKISLCSVCSLQPTAALIQNNKWYHKIHSALLPVHIPNTNALCLLLYSPWPM